MRAGHLFIRELRFRRVSFALAVVAAAAVSACVVGARSFLAAHDAETEELVAALEERALGLGSRAIFALMLYKAVLTGVAGGVFGSLVGVLAGRWVLGISATATTPFMLSVIGATIAISVIASALPALLAARTGPALILNQE